MRYIEKIATNEPLSLHLHKAQKLPLPNYDNFREKSTVLEALWKEQFGLCAYCMQRLQNWESDKMRIEHFKPQDKYNGENGFPNLLLEYSNYLGVCQGGQNSATHLYHCDKSKKNKEIELCPHDLPIMMQIKFASDGTIFTENEQYNREINTILYLNLEHFRKDRKKIIEVYQKIFQKEKNVTQALLQKEINRWTKIIDGKLQPFCQVAIYYLQRKLQKLF